MIIDAAPPDKKAGYGKPLDEGFNNFNVTLENVQKALNSTYFRDRHLTAVGKTEWDQINWNDASIAEKRNVIHNANIVFTAAENINSFHKAQNALVRANVNSRLLDCSDAHNLSASSNKDRIGNCFTWIKGDTTFAGLVHAIKEYDKRVFIGDCPKKLEKIKANPTKYIERIEIRKIETSTLSEPWFDFALPINADLVAIIGNKGSGKSALSDTLGLLGDTKQTAHFSFLNPKKFRDPRENKASHFRANLTWRSGSTSTRTLSDDPTPNSIETVKYLPQNYIETLCNELAINGSGFDSELKQIILSHVDPSDRLGYGTLDSLLSYLTAETEATKRVLIEKLHVLNDKISQLEGRTSKANREKLQSRLKIKQDELTAHDKLKPSYVPEPTQSEEVKQASAAIRNQIIEKKKELDGLASQLSNLNTERTECQRKSAVLNKALTKLKNFQLQWKEFTEALELDLQSLAIDQPIELTEIVSLTINRSKLDELRLVIDKQVKKIDEQLDAHEETSPIARKNRLERELLQLQESLDAPNREYVAYQNALETWTKRRLSLQGDASLHESLTWLQNQLAELENIPAKLQNLKAERVELAREIYRETKKLADCYKKLYQPVQQFIDQQEGSMGAIPLSFEVSIIESGFGKTFLEKINRQIKGTFSGLEESNIELRRILDATQFDNEESVLGFLEELDSALHFDLRQTVPGRPALELSDQLRKGETVNSMYDYIYSLSYLSPRYTLQYAGREINQLSPGERGLLLLVFYLLIDKDDIPLVIDQPEENLDNQTIYEILVRCLREAKLRRQIIIVTHNPNLAVVCDAEQVIYADRDAATNSVTYEAGAIENPTINKHVIDVLEGTRPAFKNRDSKYFAEG